MTAPHHRRLRGRTALAVLTAGALAVGAAPAAWAANDVVGPGTDLYVDPHSTTVEAAAGLTGQARDDALLLAGFPTATWFTAGTPAEVQAEADRLVTAAAAEAEVPTLVAYNLPFRDCAQYSAGGATSVAEYTAWVDAFAAGIGDRAAIVILEPDGLGIIPHYTTINGELEWCQPAEADPATAAAERFAMLNHAVDALTALPSTAVYLDGTHTGWLGVGDVTDRLIKAGVERADGFFLNASNYQETPKLQKYGAWISQCIDLSVTTWWEPAWCASQYYPATPTDFSTWGLTDDAYAQAYADTGRTPDPATMKHAVIDTSRNGQGPWTPPAGVYRTRRTGATRRTAGSACARPRTPGTRTSTPSCGSRCRASPTVSASAASAAPRTPCAAWSTRPRAAGSPSRRASSSRSPSRRSRRRRARSGTRSTARGPAASSRRSG